MSVRAGVEQILGRIDIVSLISGYLEIVREEAGFRGRCPFHPDEARSFRILPEARGFRCESCGVGGDAIAFIQRYMGLSFDDAKRKLAREAGVTLKEVDFLAPERKRRQAAFDFATEHFRSCLLDPDKGRVAREYLKARGIRDEMIQAFGLGWAMPGGTELVRALEQAGLREAGIQASLIAQVGQELVDVFHGRIMFPIRSSEGRTVAFMGRLVVGEGKKYVMPDVYSLLYDEGKTLYGLEHARAQVGVRRSAVLVEGGFDCIWMHQTGFGNTVALYPNTVTPIRLQLLADAGARELIFLLDGDEAGRRAVEWNSAVVFTAGLPARVALLPQGEDPDTYAMREGTEGMQRLLDTARPLIEHLVESILPRERSCSQEDQKQVLQRVGRIARRLPPGPALTSFLSRFASGLGMTPGRLEAELLTATPGRGAVAAAG